MPKKNTLQPYERWLKRFSKTPQWPDRITVVGVYWLDAAMIEDAEDDAHGPIRAFTKGTVIKANVDFIAVAHEVFEDKTTRVVTTIPSGMVKGIIQFGVADL